MNAYAVALQNNIYQLDEIREMEDKPPLGFNFIKLGLDAVLVDPKTREIYTPNTGRLEKMNAEHLTEEDICDTIKTEKRMAVFGEGHKIIDNVSEGSGGGTKVATGIKSPDNTDNIVIGQSLSASAKNYPVKLPESKQRTEFAENQTIEGVVFAGKGTNREIRDRFRLESTYHIPADEWQKASGKGKVIIDGKEKLAELHWYEARGEKVDFKVKRVLE